MHIYILYIYSRHDRLLVGSHGHHVCGVEQLWDPQVLLGEVEGVVEVVHLVLGVERLVLNQVGPVGLLTKRQSNR